MPIKETTLTIRIESELLDRVHQQAKKEDRTAASLARIAIQQYLANLSKGYNAETKE